MAVEFLVITGLSGAGRSQAGNSLEDLGWFVIDNLPAELIPKVGELARFQGGEPAPVALAVGAGRDLDAVGPALAELKATGARVRTLFLDASNATLVRRYSDSKRRHPLLDQASSLEEAIDEERRRLEPMREQADVVIDTSELNVHDLRRRMVEHFGEAAGGSTTQVTVMSFGYKHGVPPDADLVIDCRFLPNPHWVEDLRPLTGLDPEVRDYVRSFEMTGKFLDKLFPLLDMLLPAYVEEGKSVLTIAFGCTGGHHRSVSIAEWTAQWLRDEGVEPRVRHRDVAR